MCSDFLVQTKNMPCVCSLEHFLVRSLFVHSLIAAQDLTALWKVLDGEGQEAALRAVILSAFPFVDDWVVGARVEAQYSGRNRWYPGRIAEVWG